MSAAIHWRGTVGHFIGAQNCCFRLHTLVADRYRISTIGCWHPLSADTDAPNPMGGDGRLFETMVFHETDGKLDSLNEIECLSYWSGDDAEAGHAETVRRYAGVSS